MSEADSTRWAVIGTGTISHSVVPDLQSIPGADVDLVHSRDGDKAERFAKEYSIRRHTADYETIITDETINAIYLATPFATHYELALRAIEAGKHVLVEKPMAMNAAEVESLFNAAERYNVFLMEAMWMKFNPVFQRLQSELAQGAVGEVTSLRASFGIPMPDDGGSRWDLARSGGTLLDQGIYPITMAHTILGAPRFIIAAGSVRGDGLDLDVHVTLGHSGGRYAQCASSMVSFTELTASVNGTTGWITLAAPFWATDSLQIRNENFHRIFREPETVTFQREGFGYVPMLREVTQALNAGLRQHPLHTRADSVAVFQTLDAIRQQVLSHPIAEPTAGTEDSILHDRVPANAERTRTPELRP